MAMALEAPLAFAGPPGWAIIGATAVGTAAVATAPLWVPKVQEAAHGLFGALSGFAGSVEHALGFSSAAQDQQAGAAGAGAADRVGDVVNGARDAVDPRTGKVRASKPSDKTVIKEKDGGSGQLEEDFNKVRGDAKSEPKYDENGNEVASTAETPDGKIVMRERSSDGRPTLEWQPKDSSEKKIEIRYNP